MVTGRKAAYSKCICIMGRCGHRFSFCFCRFWPCSPSMTSRSWAGLSWTSPEHVLHFGKTDLKLQDSGLNDVQLLETSACNLIYLCPAEIRPVDLCCSNMWSGPADVTRISSNNTNAFWSIINVICCFVAVQCWCKRDEQIKHCFAHVFQ